MKFDGKTIALLALMPVMMAVALMNVLPMLMRKPAPPRPPRQTSVDYSAKVLNPDLVTDPFYHPALVSATTPTPGPGALQAPSTPVMPARPSAPAVLPPPTMAGRMDPGMGDAGLQPWTPPSPGSPSAPLPSATGPLPPTGPAQSFSPSEPPLPSTPLLAFTVKGIVWGDRPFAFISVEGGPSDRFFIGDSPAEGVLVQAISSTSVTLVRGKTAKTLGSGKSDTL
ncbi:MAG: hypothetical protein MH204_02790 [Fimbriimonadaceae bacterium]|nr:hypothetical protein [Fimbriimonadaceae bacterium]